jgi:hypothetical protein
MIAAEDSAYHLVRSQDTLVDNHSRLAYQSVPAQVETNHDFLRSSSCSANQQVDLIKIQGQRLFDKHMLSSIQSHQTDLHMKLRRDTDRNHVY